MMRVMVGSSPLSRGIPDPHPKPVFFVRIIPALAGNTGRRTVRYWPRGDHPRSRGEYAALTVLLPTAVGSSPLSRGIHGGCYEATVLAGIIPALAGNTFMEPQQRHYLPDHPRSRGEYVEVGHGEFERVGSSPLSRGIPSPLRPAGLPPRIIPALAGNTISDPRRPGCRWDHPRSRGEYSCQLIRVMSPRGSSPLSRGILPPRHGVSRRQRIIPALAGNTGLGPASMLAMADHPRSRGEYPHQPPPCI